MHQKLYCVLSPAIIFCLSFEQNGFYFTFTYSLDLVYRNARAIMLVAQLKMQAHRYEQTKPTHTLTGPPHNGTHFSKHGTTTDDILQQCIPFLISIGYGISCTSIWQSPRWMLPEATSTALQETKASLWGEERCKLGTWNPISKPTPQRAWQHMF